MINTATNRSNKSFKKHEHRKFEIQFHLNSDYKLQNSNTKKRIHDILSGVSSVVPAAEINAQTLIYSNNFDNPSSFTLEAGTHNAWLINNVYQGGALFSGNVIPYVPTQPASFSNPK
jgi:hypothetical protein